MGQQVTDGCFSVGHLTDHSQTSEYRQEPDVSTMVDDFEKKSVLRSVRGQRQTKRIPRGLFDRLLQGSFRDVDRL